MQHYILGDLVDEISERENSPSTSKYERFVGLEHYVSGDVEIKNYGSTSKLNSAMKVFKSGDILVARRNVYLRRASVVYFEGLTSGDSIVLRAKDDAFGKLLPFILNTSEFWDYAEKHSDGTMSKRLSPKILKSYEFDLPDSVDIESLAEILWSAFDTKEAYTNLLNKTKELVRAQFMDLFYGHNYPEVTMDSVLVQHTKTEKITDTLNEKYVTVALHGKGVRERNIETYDPKPFSGYRIKAGQFIYSRIDARNGALGIVPSELDNAVVSKDFPVFSILEDKVLPEVLLFSVLDENFIQQIQKNSMGTTNRQRIKEEVFLKYTIVLAPIDATSVKLPEEVVDDSPYSPEDNMLLQEFTDDYDEIMVVLIGKNYAESLVDMTLPCKIKDLYENKWISKADSFSEPSLKSHIFALLGELNNISNSFLVSDSAAPFLGSARVKIRNLYVKLHPEQFAGSFPYDAFIDDWEDGEY